MQLITPIINFFQLNHAKAGDKGEHVLHGFTLWLLHLQEALPEDFQGLLQTEPDVWEGALRVGVVDLQPTCKPV